MDMEQPLGAANGSEGKQASRGLPRTEALRRPAPGKGSYSIGDPFDGLTLQTTPMALNRSCSPSLWEKSGGQPSQVSPGIDGGVDLLDSEPHFQGQPPLTGSTQSFAFIRKLMKKRDKSKKKKSESSNSKENSFEGKDGNGSLTGSTLSGDLKVDEEGYIIRTPVHEKKPEVDNFYSSSDSDSGNEDVEKKLRFEIKPVLGNGGASVDELRETVKGLSICLSKSASTSSVMGPPLLPIPRPSRRSHASPKFPHQNNMIRSESYCSLSLGEKTPSGFLQERSWDFDMDVVQPMEATNGSDGKKVSHGLSGAELRMPSSVAGKDSYSVVDPFDALAPQSNQPDLNSSYSPSLWEKSGSQPSQVSPSIDGGVDLLDSETQFQGQPSLTGSTQSFAFIRKLMKKRDKNKKKKSGASNSKEDSSLDDNASTPGSTASGDLKVDEEGYVIRTPVHEEKPEVDNFYSSSDSDSGNEDVEKKLRFEIKPVIGNGGASVAELRETIKSLSICLSKSSSTSSVMGPPLVPIPRLSRRSHASLHFPHQNNMTRCESYGSLSSDFRMTPVSVCSSRGPSPLTLGLNDAFPLAVAFQESIRARFKGTDETRCEVQIFGSLKMAFPSGIIQALANNPSPASLTFKITNASRIEKLHPNKEIINITENTFSPKDQHTFEVNVNLLVIHLRKLVEKTPNARYYNVDMLKYQVHAFPGAKSCPLQVVTHWKCEPRSTGLKVDYKYNPAALSCLVPLKNIIFTVNVNSNVSDVQGKPPISWNAAAKQAIWRCDQFSRHSDGNGLGSLRAKFDVTNGPSNPCPVGVQFSCVDATLSGVKFEINSGGYRVSLVKKQVTSGRYTSEADCNINYASI